MPPITKKRSTQVAFAVAPVVPGLTIVIAEHMAGTQDAFGVFGVLVFGYLYSWLPMLVLGLPSFLLARHLRLVKWWSALCAGLIIGAAVYTAIQHSITDRGFVVYTIAGAASGLCFWCIWSLGKETNVN